MWKAMESINWLGLVSLLLVAILVAPAAIRMNRGGQWLPRAAVWLTILVGLVFVYQTFGPF
jgi:heme/copper-type cytochrome/quinol oxidase subunit 3